MGTFILIIFLLAIALPVSVITVGTIGNICTFFYESLISRGKESRAILTAPTFKEKREKALIFGYNLLFLPACVGLGLFVLIS